LEKKGSAGLIGNDTKKGDISHGGRKERYISLLRPSKKGNYPREKKREGFFTRGSRKGLREKKGGGFLSIPFNATRGGGGERVVWKRGGLLPLNLIAKKEKKKKGTVMAGGLFFFLRDCRKKERKGEEPY